MDIPNPHNLDFEIGVLGAMISSPELAVSLPSIVDVECFYSTKHQNIYKIIRALEAEQAPISIDSVIAKIKPEAVTKGGYRSLLLECANQAYMSVQAEYYAGQLADLRNRRRAITTMKQGLHDAQENIPTTKLIGDIEYSLGEIMTARNTTDSSIKEDILDVWEYYNDVLSGQTERMWVKTGFHDIDRLITIEPSIHVVIGARPRMGKTSMALQIAIHIARSGKRPLYISTEMSKRRLLQRIITQMSRINHQRHISGKLTNVEIARVNHSMNDWANLNVGMLDGQWSVEEIRRVCIQEKRKNGLDSIFVDLINKLKRPAGISTNAKEHLIVNENSKRLAELGVELDIPVFTLQHLNRDVDKRSDQRPVLGDLREAGEEYADIVIFPYLEEKVNPQTERKGMADVEVAKNRDGDEGSVELLWVGENLTFLNKSKYHDLPEEPRNGSLGYKEGDANWWGGRPQ